MKNVLLTCCLLFSAFIIKAQKDNPITLLMDSRDKYAEAVDFKGRLTWQKQNGDEKKGHFVVWGERFRIEYGFGEMRCDGEFLWEIDHRARRIKKRHYNPLLAPAIVFAFRLYRMNLESESLVVAGKPPKVYVEVDYGASIMQGSHLVEFDPKSKDIKAIYLHENQGEYHEKAEITELSTDSNYTETDYQIVDKDWKKQGYTILDMATGLPEVMPEEKVLKSN